jgi:hypothetical protein
MAVAKPFFAIMREFQQFDVCFVERSQQFALGFEFKVKNIVLGISAPSRTRIIKPITSLTSRTAASPALMPD